MPSRFSNFVKPSTPQPPLPYMHTCECFDLRGIVENNKLNPTPCEVFIGEPLIYLFYELAPSYRTSKDNVAISSNAFMPVCIVLKENILSSPKRIFPFDTGAFKNGIYLNQIQQRMTLDNFLIESSLDMPARLVTCFYGSNEKYFLGEPKNIKIPLLDLEVDCYYNLISEKSKTRSDDRRSTVEIQSNQPIQLNRNSVMLVVLPGIFLDIPEIRDRIVGEWTANVCTYHIRHANPNEYIGEIYREVANFLKSRNYF